MNTNPDLSECPEGTIWLLGLNSGLISSAERDPIKWNSSDLSTRMQKES